MYARCPECPSCNWVSPPATAAMEEVVCASCGANGLVHGCDTLQEQVAGLSNERGVDLASAYSVALGLMTLERALELKEFGPPPAPPVEPATAHSAIERRPHVEANYDPAFREAIDAGRMSVQEAVERGDREAYSLQLARVHKLNHDLACMVTDKRIGLKEAIEQSARVKTGNRKRATAAPPRKVTRPQLAIVVLAGVALVSLVAIGAWRSATAPPDVPARSGAPIRSADSGAAPAASSDGARDAAAIASPSPRATPIEIHRDPNGLLVQLVGPSPRHVLEAYCEAGGPDVRPVEVSDTSPPMQNAYLGTFRDPRAGDGSIRIRQDWRTRRWVAGDGRSPIQVLVPPDLPIDAYRLPVTAD